MPAGKTVKVGVWEDEQFIGCVIFSIGSNRNIGSPYGLTQQEICELTRVALKKHKTPVSQILAKSIKMLKRQSPGLRLIISFADETQGHLGGIYQATNWIYVGEFAQSAGVRIKGKIVHRRTLNSRYGTSTVEWLRKHVDPRAAAVQGKPKHKYLMPLDRQMRKQVAPLSLPYPKTEDAGKAVQAHTEETGHCHSL